MPEQIGHQNRLVLEYAGNATRLLEEKDPAKRAELEQKNQELAEVLGMPVEEIIDQAAKLTLTN